MMLDMSIEIDLDTDLIICMMATEDQPQRKQSCNEFPDFAASCIFIEQFGESLGLLPLHIKNLKDGFEDTSEGNSLFLHLKSTAHHLLS